MGPVSEVKVGTETLSLIIMTPTRVGDANSIIVSVGDVEKDFDKLPSEPIIKHVRSCEGDTPFACLMMFGDDEFYFSRCHPKDSYCKKTGRDQAKANGVMTYKEAVIKITGQKGNGWDEEYSSGSYQKDKVLVDLARMKDYGDVYFGSSY